MLNQPHRNITFYRARNLRKKMTYAERTLWCSLRKGYLSPYKFRRQVAIGKYIVDFLCVEVKLVIEIDGPSHLLQQDYDKRRTQWLESRGYTVMRFQNDDVINGSEKHLSDIYNMCVLLNTEIS